MNIFWRLTSILVILFLLTACDISPHKTPITSILEGKTMGTFWRVNVVNISQEQVKQLRTSIQAQLDSDDQLLSSWKDDSALMRFNLSRSTSPWPISEVMADIITKSLHVGYKTNGAVDITVGALVNLWGFGPDKQPLTTPSLTMINNTRTRTGLHHITIINQYGQQYIQKDIPDLFIDLSTVGEGYAADHLASLMAQEGITHFLVSVGGALVSRGMNASNQPWRVAIQKPTEEQNAVQAIVNINGNGISTSGNYRNYYELNGKRISHIIDPQTGWPVEHNILSVTVIAPTALEADAWDSGLMVLGKEKAKDVVRKHKLAVYMITKEGDNLKNWMSPQFRSYLLRMQN